MSPGPRSSLKKRKSSTHRRLQEETHRFGEINYTVSLLKS
jgi:hypothetical protein